MVLRSSVTILSLASPSLCTAWMSSDSFVIVCFDFGVC
jgi:hypothetical protein